MGALIILVIAGGALWWWLNSVQGDAEGHDTTQTQGGGMQLDANQIAQYASAAGFSGNDLITAVAIALAESGGWTEGYNPELQAGTPAGEGSVGLWQIYQKVHPEFSSEDLKDPQTNADAAFSVYSKAGNSFKPWSTYNTYSNQNGKLVLVSVGTGVYQNYINDAQAAVSGVAVTCAPSCSQPNCCQ